MTLSDLEMSFHCEDNVVHVYCNIFMYFLHVRDFQNYEEHLWLFPNDSWVCYIENIAQCVCSVCPEHDDIVEGNWQHADGEGRHGR